MKIDPLLSLALPGLPQRGLALPFASLKPLNNEETDGSQIPPSNLHIQYQSIKNMPCFCKLSVF